jgi:hypothetical protein
MPEIPINRPTSNPPFETVSLVEIFVLSDIDHIAEILYDLVGRDVGSRPARSHSRRRPHFQ